MNTDNNYQSLRVIAELQAAVTQKRISFEQFIKAVYLSPDELNRHNLNFQEIFHCFVTEHGQVVRFHYCDQKKVAAILTQKTIPYQPSWRDRAVAYLTNREVKKTTTHYSLFTDYTLGEYPELERLLVDCDHLAVETRRLLDGNDLEACNLMLYAIAKRVLCLIDYHLHQHDAEANSNESGATTTASSPPVSKDLQDTQTHAHDKIVELLSQQIQLAKNYHKRAAQLKAQSFYFSGMIIGIAILLVLMLFYPWLSPMDGFEPQMFSSLLICGGVGSMVSIMSRISFRSLMLDYEAGKSILMRVGIFRPILGAIFALIVYALLQSGLLPIKVPTSASASLFFQYVIGFLAGFSERWVPDILDITQKSVNNTNTQTTSQ